MSTTALSPVVIQVRFDRVYGNVLCYPVNDAAKNLAAIAGTKTLSPDCLKRARALGLVVEDGGTAANILDSWGVPA